MQRIFSTFPGAMPGFGLLVLRVYLGVSVVFHSVVYLMNQQLPALGPVLGGAFGVICGVLLMAGFLTPIVSLVVCMAAIASLVFSYFQLSVGLDVNSLSTICCLLVSVALIFLGPGAFSIDSRLFGRREIVISSAGGRSER